MPYTTGLYFTTTLQRGTYFHTPHQNGNEGSATEEALCMAQGDPYSDAFSKAPDSSAMD